MVLPDPPCNDAVDVLPIIRCDGAGGFTVVWTQQGETTGTTEQLFGMDIAKLAKKPVGLGAMLADAFRAGWEMREKFK